MGRTRLFGAVRRLIRKAVFDDYQRQFSSLEPDQVFADSPSKREQRRGFLKKALMCGAGALATSACKSRSFALTEEWAQGLLEPQLETRAWGVNREDVVIVGAGLSGLTTAFQLQKEGITSRVIEGSKRIGGRVFTQNNVDADGRFFERGAEFIDSQHTHLLDLAAQLGLQVQELPVAAEGIEDNLYFYGNNIYKDKDFVAELSAVLPKILADLKRCLSPDGVSPSYKDMFGAAEFDKISLGDYIHSLSLPAWCSRMLELAYVGEIGVDWERQSALTFLLLFDRRLDDGFQMFGDSDESKRIKGGNGQLCHRLAQVLTVPPATSLGLSAVPLHVGWRLVALREAGAQLKLIFSQANGTQRELLASHVVCTLPFSTLREVDGWELLDLSAPKKRAIKSLAYGTNAKLMLNFKNPFWRSPHPGIPASLGSLYMADQGGQVWDTGRGQPGNGGLLTFFTGGQGGKEMTTAASQQLLQFLKHNYKSGVEYREQPKKILHSWAAEPLNKGSYAAWGPGDYGAFVGALGEPELQGRLLFAGEHVSTEYQGFMNGAVESAMAAAEYLIEVRRGLR